MKEKIIENGIEYVKCGDYYIPNLKAPEGTYNIGKYGRLHSIFIKENRPCLYSAKMLKGTWLAYLEEIDTTAKEMVDNLVKYMAVKQGFTEELKSKNQMAWVGAMNSIKHSAEEFVLKDFVYSMEERR
ncbi:MAG: TnpV protein [Clostridia bacterium]|nr:TnpV protein [Clostridia bacterium]